MLKKWKLVLGLLVASLLIGCAAPPQPYGDSTPQQAVRVDSGRRPIPDYPEIALKNRWQGLAALRVVVASDCRASSVEVTQSTGYSVLDDKAKKAVSNWTFRPEEVGTNMVSIRFSLEDSIKESD